jgi:hypothetical protein
MPDSDDGSQHDGSYGSGHDYSSPEDTDSEHEEEDKEDTNSDRKQTVLALLEKLKEEIENM